MYTRTILHTTRTALTRPVTTILPRRWNHARITFQSRDADYAFYDLSIQQPVGSKPTDNPFPTLISEAKEQEAERQEQAEMAARMDEESGRTTGAGRPPTPPPQLGIIFGSRLAGPAARPPPPPEKVRTVEGIKVPPRPDEPDNCCMSGCVHCVWDIYREDIEDWQSSRQRAREVLKAKKKRIPVWLGGKAAQKEEFDPLGDVDVGLRAFMELEKRLKERKEAREHAAL